MYNHMLYMHTVYLFILLSDILSGIYPVILSGICSEILSDILYGILSGTCSGPGPTASGADEGGGIQDEDWKRKKTKKTKKRRTGTFVEI